MFTELRRTSRVAFDTPLLATPGGFPDERLEELHVLARLRMPEDAESKAPIRGLDRLDRPVHSVCGDSQPLADPAEALVVMRLDRRAVAEQRFQLRSRLERHVVVSEGARRVLVLLVADDLREVLDEIPAARDVQHLRAPADREHRQVALERRLEERELRAVTLG